MTKRAAQKHDTGLERQPYTRPTLREFGPVGKLTQSGTIGQIEPGAMNNPNRRP